MIRQSFKPDKLWFKELLQAKEELAAVTAGIMLSEFKELLLDASQRTGTYVANFRIGVAGEVAPSIKKDDRGKENWYIRGSMASVNQALAANRGVKSLARSTGGAAMGFVPVITLENDTPYAEDVEAGIPGVRPENEGGPGAVSRFAGRVEAITSKRIYVGRGTWNMYRDKDI